MSAYMVYTMWDAGGAIIYVGVTSRGRKRIEEHERKKSWFPNVAFIGYEAYSTIPAASDRERELIEWCKPLYNGRTSRYGYRPVVLRLFPIKDDTGMTLKELAAYLGISSVGSLRTQIERGALKATRAGNQWMVDDDEAARYKANHRAGEGKRGRPPKERGDA